jgi:hypothetical protein
VLAPFRAHQQPIDRLVHLRQHFGYEVVFTEGWHSRRAVFPRLRLIPSATTFLVFLAAAARAWVVSSNHVHALSRLLSSDQPFLPNLCPG